MSTTTDPNDPRLGNGVDTERRPQNEVYLVLSEEERAKGFVRPVRSSYRHVGAAGPKFPLRDLTDKEHELYGDIGYVKFEVYPPGHKATGKFWTQEQLNNIDKGCNGITSMGQALSETYARSPKFYGATYCIYCEKHLPVGEFVWVGTDIRVGE